MTLEAQIGEFDLDTLLPKPIDRVQALPEDAEILPLKYPKTYWFNSYKLPIGDIAVARIKEGIKSNSTSSKGDSQVNKTKYNFSAQIKRHNDNALAEVKGKVEILNEYIMTSGGILDDLLNIETETFGGNLSYVRRLSATIDIKSDTSQIWMMDIRTNGEASNFSMEDSFLFCGNRFIRIALNEDNVPEDLAPSKFPDFDFRRYTVLGYDFIENGKTIGSLKREGENAVILDPDLDPTTKLVLISAMIVMEK